MTLQEAVQSYEARGWRVVHTNSTLGRVTLEAPSRWFRPIRWTLCLLTWGLWLFVPRNGFGVKGVVLWMENGIAMERAVRLS
jgi:hypothetical protein